MIMRALVLPRKVTVWKMIFLGGYKSESGTVLSTEEKKNQGPHWRRQKCKVMIRQGKVLEDLRDSF